MVVDIELLYNNSVIVLDTKNNERKSIIRKILKKYSENPEGGYYSLHPDYDIADALRTENSPFKMRSIC